MSRNKNALPLVMHFLCINTAFFTNNMDKKEFLYENFK